jgi:hypothetical protein
VPVDQGGEQSTYDGGIGDDTPMCPYGHGTSWVYIRYGKEYVCAKCGVRIVNFPGVALT